MHADQTISCGTVDVAAAPPLDPGAMVVVRPVHGYRSFTGEYLGTDRNAATRILGENSRLPAMKACGFALVADTGRVWPHGGCLLRLPTGTCHDSAKEIARRAAADGPVILCEAVAGVGPLVLFRDTSRFERREVTDVLRDAQEAADQILAHCCNVDVRKAIDPLSRSGFDSIVFSISKKLRSFSIGSDAQTLREAIKTLDVDWPTLTPEGRAAAVQAMRLAVGRAPERLLPKVEETLSVESNRVVKGTRTGARKTMNLRIGANLNETDRRIAEHVSSSQINFVRDEYWRRADDASMRAREIVARGIAQGLGRDDIAQELSTEMAATVVGRSEAYWDVVASAFVGRARSFALLSSFNEAGIERYIFSAVLDEVTTDICRFMDGKVFPVRSGLDLLDRTENLESPEDIKRIQPWVRTGVDEKGKQIMFVDQGGGARTTVARVVESAVGRRDEVGRFSRKMSDSDLESNGLVMPPLHGLCRSSLLPEV